MSSSSSVISRIKQERLKKQVSRLESNREQLRKLKEFLDADKTLLKNPNFQYRRYLVLEAILNDLPEEEASSFTALEGTVCREGYKSTWDILNLDIHIDSLKNQIHS